MTLIEVKNRLSKIGLKTLQTYEVAKILDLSNAQASLVLHRLEKAGEVLSLKKGLWLIDKEASVFSIGEHLARPYSAYVSLQSALYLHGLISQMPQIHYFVTTARSQKRDFSNSRFSFHHIEAYLFEGFITKEGFNIATPEKALFDFFYLSATRKQIFKSLPELEIPKKFSKKNLVTWCRKIKNPRLRSHVTKLIGEF